MDERRWLDFLFLTFDISHQGKAWLIVWKIRILKLQHYSRSTSIIIHNSRHYQLIGFWKLDFKKHNGHYFQKLTHNLSNTISNYFWIKTLSLLSSSYKSKHCFISSRVHCNDSFFFQENYTKVWSKFYYSLSFHFSWQFTFQKQ